MWSRVRRAAADRLKSTPSAYVGSAFALSSIAVASIDNEEKDVAVAQIPEASEKMHLISSQVVMRHGARAPFRRVNNIDSSVAFSEQPKLLDGSPDVIPTHVSVCVHSLLVIRSSPHVMT